MEAQRGEPIWDLVFQPNLPAKSLKYENQLLEWWSGVGRVQTERLSWNKQSHLFAFSFIENYVSTKDYTYFSSTWKLNSEYLQRFCLNCKVYLVFNMFCQRFINVNTSDSVKIVSSTSRELHQWIRLKSLLFSLHFNSHKRNYNR